MDDSRSGCARASWIRLDVLLGASKTHGLVLDGQEFFLAHVPVRVPPLPPVWDGFDGVVQKTRPVAHELIGRPNTASIVCHPANPDMGDLQILSTISRSRQLAWKGRFCTFDRTPCSPSYLEFDLADVLG